jgi:hypothetical protein
MILTDVTKGAQGNDERLAFLYDPRRVKPSGRACELLLPGVEYTGAGGGFDFVPHLMTNLSKSNCPAGSSTTTLPGQSSLATNCSSGHIGERRMLMTM